MIFKPQTFRVSRQFLANLWLQALFGSLGTITSTFIFWVIAESLVPVPEFANRSEALIRLSSLSFYLDFDRHRDRELFRFGIGPFLTMAVWLGGIGDFLAWVAVQYEAQAEKLVMRWKRWNREIPWDVMKTIEERPHRKSHLRSLLISASGTPPILVRGLEQVNEFSELLRSRISPLTKWNSASTSIDMTSRLLNFSVGFLLPIPLHGTWILAYAGNWSELSLMSLWSFLLIPIVGFLWFRKPLSRSHSCSREIEVSLAMLMLLLSGVLSFAKWIASPSGIQFMSWFF